MFTCIIGGVAIKFDANIQIISEIEECRIRISIKRAVSVPSYASPQESYQTDDTAHDGVVEERVAHLEA